jgi:DNA-binding NtrC family response regulator
LNAFLSIKINNIWNFNGRRAFHVLTRQYQCCLCEPLWHPNTGRHGRKNLMAVILIVDDEVFIRGVTEMMIQDMGHETLGASDMDEALVHLKSPQPIDALFTDVRLKSIVLGGFELAHQAISLRPELRVLYTTGSSLTDKMRALFVEGAHFMQKPYTPVQLQTSMKELLAASL